MTAERETVSGQTMIYEVQRDTHAISAGFIGADILAGLHPRR